MIAPLAPLVLSLRRRVADLAAQLALIALMIPAVALVWLRDRWIERRTLLHLLILTQLSRELFDEASYQRERRPAADSGAWSPGV
jgi:hypothetical protein